MMALAPDRSKDPLKLQLSVSEKFSTVVVATSNCSYLISNSGTHENDSISKEVLVHVCVFLHENALIGMCLIRCATGNLKASSVRNCAYE